jgi:hypothetical protein
MGGAEREGKILPSAMHLVLSARACVIADRLVPFEIVTEWLIYGRFEPFPSLLRTTL